MDGLFSKGLSKVAVAQLRDVIREEIKAELSRIITPTFLETVTRGQQQMERIFDAVLSFQDELDEVKVTLSILQEGVEAKSQPADLRAAERRADWRRDGHDQG